MLSAINLVSSANLRSCIIISRYAVKKIKKSRLSFLDNLFDRNLYWLELQSHIRRAPGIHIQKRTDYSVVTICFLIADKRFFMMNRHISHSPLARSRSFQQLHYSKYILSIKQSFFLNHATRVNIFLSKLFYPFPICQYSCVNHREKENRKWVHWCESVCTYKFTPDTGMRWWWPSADFFSTTFSHYFSCI